MLCRQNFTSIVRCTLQLQCSLTHRTVKHAYQTQNRVSATDHDSSNSTAIIELEQILNSKRNQNHLLDTQSIEQSFSIYRRLKQPADHRTISLLIRIYSNSSFPETSLFLLMDIKSLSNRRLIPLKSVINLSISLLDCCLKSKTIPIQKCLDILQFTVSITDHLCLKLHGNTITKLIKKCHCNLNALQYLDSLISNHYFVGDLKIIKTALINGYGTCSQSESGIAVDAAYSLFNSMKPTHSIQSGSTTQSTPPDIISIGAMMKVFITHCRHLDALKLYGDSIDIHIQNAITHTLAIKACKGCGDQKRGNIIIERIEAMDEEYSGDLLLKSTIIDFYGYFGDISSALRVFESIKDDQKTSVNINAMMTALTQNGDNDHALRVYKEYQLLQNEVSDLLALKAAKKMNRKEIGISIHRKIRNLHKTRNVQLVNGLIDFYGHFGDIINVNEIFESLTDGERDNVTIATMMNVHITANRPADALTIYHRYKHLVDISCSTLAVKACSILKDYETGRAIIMKQSKCSKQNEKRSLENVKSVTTKQDIDFENTVIHFYGVFGEIENAQQRFNDIADENRNTETITVMMEAFCKNDRYCDCVELLFDLQQRKVPCDLVWYNIALKACTQGTLSRFGQAIHRYLECHEPELLQQSSLMINLLNMYGKCAMIDECEDIFEGITSGNLRDIPMDQMVEIYNAMIHVYGRNGAKTKALSVFERIKQNNEMVPDRKTYILMINGCSHCGDMDTAMDIWNSMCVENKSMKKDAYVVTAMVDGLARKGQLQKARDLIAECHVNEEVVWKALLSGCVKHNDHEMAQEIHQQIQSKLVSPKMDNVESKNAALVSFIRSQRKQQ